MLVIKSGAHPHFTFCSPKGFIIFLNVAYINNTKKKGISFCTSKQDYSLQFHLRLNLNVNNDIFSTD